MNAEEKAKEIVEKFMKQPIHALGLHLKRNNPEFRMDYQSAKACAIILCDEILNNRVPLLICDILFWQSVKQSIINQ